MPDRPLAPMPLARGRHGAVVAPHHLASAAGLAVLRRGGTAVDAAIATNAVLAVVAPQTCGLGGDAFWLIWDAGAVQRTALNGSGAATAFLDPAPLRAGGMTHLPLRGPLTITVPGAVRSWGAAYARHGRLARDVVLAAAIELAADGFPAWDGFIDAVESGAPIFRDALGPGSGWEVVYRPNGRAWRPGELVRLPALAATLEGLADAGFDDFYDGDLAHRQSLGLAAAGSPLDRADLLDHASTWGDPLVSEYRGVEVTTHPPNSQGLTALEILNVLERFEPPDAAVFAPGAGADARWIHLGVEASKLAMADRDAFVTDPAYRDVPTERLLDKAYAADLAGRIDPLRAALPPPSRQPRGGGTAYIGVVDGEGNAVSLIESNYMGFGSGVVDPGTGIGYHNRGAYFSLEPGHPNVLEPGKRTLHTLVPGMLFRDGRPWIVAGSMGGDAQPQIHVQLVSSLVDGALEIATGIAAPRWFVEPLSHFDPPVEVRAEPRFRDGVLDELERLGHPVTRTAAFSSILGHCHAIEVVDGGPGAGGSLAAATDPRSAGLPAAF